jgi:hypothetical protein
MFSAAFSSRSKTVPQWGHSWVLVDNVLTFVRPSTDVTYKHIGSIPNPFQELTFSTVIAAKLAIALWNSQVMGNSREFIANSH